ncbi:putative Very-long-chain 3-oxoacyl-CoA reductase-A [Hypsibius exemplaris]|uniref:Very-long-chain 3-oxoacyl-CoA reductase-A n=1 Tax=Hypsibius exemplaris TaxID=2072580 RepID=A0A1W0WWS5_HYPEX|nr:putative Very-long-chain 3-oxoacyl-CoA reductase-A [Hypsibius exemplaris]
MLSRFQFPSQLAASLPFVPHLDKALAPLGSSVKTYAAAIGAVYVAVKTTQAVACLGRGLVSYVLANPLHLAGDLRKVGDWAVVTGASDGIGKEYAHQLAAKGLNVVLFGRNQEKTEQVAQEIRSVYKVLAKVIILDLARITADDVKVIQEQLLSLKIALLINNAGIICDTERFLAAPVTDEKAVDMVNVNITAVVLVTRAVLPIMLAQGKGYIMNMSSGLGEKPVIGMALYAASKTFIDYFSQALDYEYKCKGVRVQSVICGMVATNMLPVKQRSSCFTADPRAFVSSALGLVGVRQRHHGHWKAALMSLLGRPMPAYCLLPCNK